MIRKCATSAACAYVQRRTAACLPSTMPPGVSPTMLLFLDMDATLMHRVHRRATAASTTAQCTDVSAAPFRPSSATERDGLVLFQDVPWIVDDTEQQSTDSASEGGVGRVDILLRPFVADFLLAVESRMPLLEWHICTSNAIANGLTFTRRLMTHLANRRLHCGQQQEIETGVKNVTNTFVVNPKQISTASTEARIPMVLRSEFLAPCSSTSSDVDSVQDGCIKRPRKDLRRLTELVVAHHSQAFGGYSGTPVSFLVDDNVDVFVPRQLHVDKCGFLVRPFGCRVKHRCGSAEEVLASVDDEDREDTTFRVTPPRVSPPGDAISLYDVVSALYERSLASHSTQRHHYVSEGCCVAPPTQDDAFSALWLGAHDYVCQTKLEDHYHAQFS